MENFTKKMSSEKKNLCEKEISSADKNYQLNMEILSSLKSIPGKIVNLQSGNFINDEFNKKLINPEGKKTTSSSISKLSKDFFYEQIDDKYISDKRSEDLYMKKKEHEERMNKNNEKNNMIREENIQRMKQKEENILNNLIQNQHQKDEMFSKKKKEEEIIKKHHQENLDWNEYQRDKSNQAFFEKQEKIDQFRIRNEMEKKRYVEELQNYNRDKEQKVVEQREYFRNMKIDDALRRIEEKNMEFYKNMEMKRRQNELNRRKKDEEEEQKKERMVYERSKIEK